MVPCKQRRGDAGDGDYREQRHLQAGVEEAAGTDGQQAERGKADGVQRAAFAIKQTAEQVERDHPQRALHRRGESGEERVAEGSKNGEERGRNAGETQAAREPEDASGDDGEMKAGDHQHVKGAGALKAHAQGMSEVGAVAGDHGGQHDGVVLAEAQGSGQTAHGRGQGQQAGARGMLPAADSAGEESAGCGTEAVDAIDAHSGRGGDALIEEKIFAAPDAGIVIDLGRQQAHNGADALSAMKGLRVGLIRGIGYVWRWPANRESHAACDGSLRIDGVVDDFE